MGGNYSGSISANSGYSTPGSVTVMMNGRNLTSSEYTFRNGTVTITIPVDGDIEITASCPWNWCLIEGTMIALADGTTIPIEEVNYDTLLKVWNYETGSVGAEYPAWIEKAATTMTYRVTRFDDGTELKTAGWHGVFDVDQNAFVSIDGEGFGVGSRIYKVNENDELEIITVTEVEIVEEEVNYYHVVSSKYYNIIANSVITTDGAVYLSNLYGFDENIKWPELRQEVISDPDNLYTYADFEDIGLPLRMFEELRMAEAKYLASVYGITLEAFKGYLISNQLNTDIWLPYCDASPIRTEYCYVPSEEEEVVETPQAAPQSAPVSNNVEPDEPDSEEQFSRPLGVTNSLSEPEYVTEKTTTYSFNVGATVLAATSLVAAGVFGLMGISKKDDDK